MTGRLDGSRRKGRGTNRFRIISDRLYLGVEEGGRREPLECVWFNERVNVLLFCARIVDEQELLADIERCAEGGRVRNRDQTRGPPVCQLNKHVPLVVKLNMEISR